MSIAAQLEIHAKQELDHAIIIAKQIDYLGGMPSVTAEPVKTSKKAKDMLKFDLDNETITIKNYRERVRQCEELDEFATAELIRDILIQEQDHQIVLATALGALNGYVLTKWRFRGEFRKLAAPKNRRP